MSSSVREATQFTSNSSVREVSIIISIKTQQLKWKHMQTIREAEKHSIPRREKVITVFTFIHCSLPDLEISIL